MSHDPEPQTSPETAAEVPGAPEVIVDVLGEPFHAETIALPDDEEGPVVATLVTRRAEHPTGRAVLHVHGFADYFFQAEYAAWWGARGYDFYALDLRKYGRSLLPHQTPNYVTDLGVHHAEIGEAWRRITERDGHHHVVASGHSTGGLTLALWADDTRPPELAGMFLNSPWLDLQGSVFLRTVGTVALKQLGQRQPRRVIPRSVNGLYGSSLHRDHQGEWDFDLTWKPLESFTVYAGWLRAVRNAHARLQAGLDVACPVLVMSSGASRWPTEMGEDVHGNDIVVDVAHIRRWATAIGTHVTYVAVPGARHDIVLSRPEPRERAYGELARWHAAYVDPRPDPAPVETDTAGPARGAGA